MSREYRFDEASFVRRELERAVIAEAVEVAKETVLRMINAHPSNAFTTDQVEAQAVHANDLQALLNAHNRETEQRYVDEYDLIVYLLRDEGDSEGRPWPAP